MKSWFLLIIFSLFFGLLGFNIASASVIFSDGFENGFSGWTSNDEKWTISGTSVPNGIHSGEKRGEVKGNTVPDDDVLLKHISTSGNGGITLEFWYRIKESLEEEDHVYIEWTADGSAWNLVNDFNLVAKSDTWSFATYVMPAEADNKDNFAIRFRAHLGAASSDIFYLDDVTLSGNGENLSPTPSPSSTPSPSPSLTPTPLPSAIPTPVPSVSKTPTPAISKTPTPAPSISKTPTPSPKNNLSPSLSPSPSTVVKTNNSSVLLSITPSPSASPSSVSNDFKELESANELSEISQEARTETGNLSASIAGAFGSKSLWLISMMVLAIVFSSVKFKRG